MSAWFLDSELSTCLAQPFLDSWPQLCSHQGCFGWIYNKGWRFQSWVLLIIAIERINTYI